MSQDETKIRIVTLEEANALLPQVRLYLKSLRDLRSIILRTQAQIEIEEMTGSSSKGEGELSPSGQAAVTRYMEILHHQSSQFEQKLSEMVQLGVYLKDLETGLVDFYAKHGGEVVFLCWKEGEEEVSHWHSLEGGYQNRKPLDPPTF